MAAHVLAPRRIGGVVADIAHDARLAGTDRQGHRGAGIRIATVAKGNDLPQDCHAARIALLCCRNERSMVVLLAVTHAGQAVAAGGGDTTAHAVEQAGFIGGPQLAAIDRALGAQRPAEVFQFVHR